MQDAELLEATSSEPLSYEEEIRMQQEWRDDEKKCTFIILARDLLSLETDVDGKGIDDDVVVDIPPSPSLCDSAKEEVEHTELNDCNANKSSYPRLIETTLDSMIGDINLFLSEEEEEEEDVDEDELADNHVRQQTVQSTTTANQLTAHINTPQLSQAEIDIMIAKPSHRHKNLGTELVLSIMHYGALYLGIKRYFVKINEKNTSSLRLFRDKLEFEECAYVKCFGEYELECKFDTSNDMIQWVEKKWHYHWKNHRRNAEGTKDEEEEESDQSSTPRRLYDVYKCPLESQT